MGFAWNVSNTMTFKVLQYNTDPHKNNTIVQRVVVVPSNLAATGYNCTLAPKIDAYFPEVQLEGGPPRKPAIPVQKGTMDPPDISIVKGG